MKRTAQAIRQEAAQMSENLASMTATYNRIADRNGWNDPRLPALDADIERIQATRRALLDSLKTAA